AEEPLDARVDRANESRADQRAGERRHRVDLAFADVDEDRARTHAAHRPADAEQHAAGDVAAMLRLQLDRDGTAERRASVAFDQPDARRGDRDRGADDAVQLRLRMNPNVTPNAA